MNILDLLRSRGLTPVHVSAAKGGEWASPCPECGGKDRFHCFPEQDGGPLCMEAGVPGTFWCRKCGAAGDLLEFLTRFESMSFADACRELRVPMKKAQPRKLPTPPRAAVHAPYAPKVCALPGATWRERAARLVEKSHARLLASPNALRWLAERGLDEYAVRRYRLGYLAEEPNKAGNSTGIIRARSAWGLEPKQKTNPDGSLSIKRSLWIPRGIVIPAYEPGAQSDPGALPIRIRIRRPDVDVEKFGDKYMVIEGSGMAPMLLGADRKAVVVVEAELDAMLVHHLAGDKAGALAVLTNLGRPDASAHQVLSRAYAVLVALDYDTAGASGWFGPEPGKVGPEGWRGWKAVYPQARRWPTPSGKDPGDAWKAGEDLRTWVLAGLPQVLQADAPETPAQQGPAIPATPAPTEPGPADAPSLDLAPAPGPDAMGPLNSGEASPQAEGVRDQADQEAACLQLPAYTTDFRQRLSRLLVFMRRNEVTFSGGTWRTPAHLPSAQADDLWTELIPMLADDVAALAKANTANVVTHENLLAPYQTQRRNS